MKEAGPSLYVKLWFSYCTSIAQNIQYVVRSSSKMLSFTSLQIVQSSTHSLYSILKPCVSSGFVIAGFKLSSVQSISCVWLFVTPWTAARQAARSITNSQSLLKLTSMELVMPSTISSSVVPFSSCLLSFPASRSFPMNQFFTSGGKSIGFKLLLSTNTHKQFSQFILFYIYLDAPNSHGMQDLQLWHVGSCPRTRDQTEVPAVGAWSPSHWTTREVPAM